MPFLFPAIVSGISDVLVLFLCDHQHEHEYEYELDLDDVTNFTAHLTLPPPFPLTTQAIKVKDDDDNFHSPSFQRVHHLGYLAVFALARLVLLVFPLPYHSYTGTRIRWYGCYRFYYGLSLLIVGIHMVALAMMDPGSLATLFSSSSSFSSHEEEETDVSRRCWFVLLLTFLSLLAHLVMLSHVRSTAPSMSYFKSHQYPSSLPLPKKKKKMMYYYTSRQSLRRLDNTNTDNTTAATNNKNNNVDRDEEDWEDVENARARPPTCVTLDTTDTMTLASPTRPMNIKSPSNNNNNESMADNDTSDSPATRPLSASPIQKLSSQYDDFVSEMQTRMSLFKQDWRHKLDDFTQRQLHRNNSHLSSSQQQQQQQQPPPQQHNHHHHSHNHPINHHFEHNNPLLPLTPFRVLLQLFAYQGDVIDSGKLDAVFDMDDGASMTFFVPQLLSFLLHGAYYESDPTKLESWILDKCCKHVYFAHRCFWFLRAWSLEYSHATAEAAASADPLDNDYDDNLPPTTTIKQRSTPSRDASQSSLDFKTPTVTNHKKGTTCSSSTPRSRSNSVASLTNPATGIGMASASSSNLKKNNKLLPEERAVVENLMLRVAHCGEGPARILHYGAAAAKHKISQPTPRKRRGKRDKQASNLSPTTKSPPHAMSPDSKSSNNNNNQESPDFATPPTPNQRKQQPQQSRPSPPPNMVMSPQRSLPEERGGLFWDSEDNIIMDDSFDSHNNNGNAYSSSLVPELVLTAEMEASLPVDPNTGFPSHGHLETLTASRRFGFMPLGTARKHRLELGIGATPLDADATPPSAAAAAAAASASFSTDSFRATPRFLDALLTMADGLFLVPREQRKLELQLQLQNLEVEMLPSNAVYVPISDVHHRVWRIVAEESIALNTKERVPCIILLEVVNYDYQHHKNSDSNNKRGKRTRSNSNGEDDDHDDHDDHDDDDDELDYDADEHNFGSVVKSWESRKTVKDKRALELPKLAIPKLPKRTENTERNTSGGEASLWEAQMSLSANSSALPLALSLPYYTMMGGMSEADVVNHWRFSKRDPHRGESVLDRMTSSLPLDMNRVKERLHQLRYRQEAIFQELLSLTNTDDHSQSSFVKSPNVDSSKNGKDQTSIRDGDSELAVFLCNDPYEGTRILQETEDNHLVLVADQHDEMDGRDLSPERDPLDVSLGQWTSPTTTSRTRNRRTVCVTPPRQRRAPEASTESDPGDKYCKQESMDRLSTAYGSTYEGRRREEKAPNVRPPRSALSREYPLGNNYNYGDGSKGATNEADAKKPPQQVVFRENWQAKEARIRRKSAFGSHPGWRLLPILVKANDDLRQEQLASQLIQRMAFILARERVPVWLCPYEIIAITDRGGIVEAIPDTISLDSLKRNDPNFVDLKTFFDSFFGHNVDDLADAKSNFVESLAAYSIVTYLLQIKDRHNGNILLDNRGHIIHIDFGFFFLSSPGKNTGFESAPFKLTRDFVEVMGGSESHSFRTFRELCVRSFIVLRRHCMEIILLVEMIKSGNEDLNCFRGRPDDAITGLRERFRLDLSDRACKEYVHSLIDESLENWRTNWYDRYQRYCVGVL